MKRTSSMIVVLLLAAIAAALAWVGGKPDLAEITTIEVYLKPPYLKDAV